MWNFSKYKNKTALIDDKGVVCTYRQLDEKCKSFSENISGRQLIFIVCENTIECIIAYVSCVMNKHPAMLVDKNMMSERYEQLLKDYKPEYVYKNGELIRTGYKTDYDINDELALLLSTSGSTGKVCFPTFECEGSYDEEFVELIEGMGVSSLYKNNQWEVSEELNNSLVKIIQNTSIRVDSHGVEAAAATGILLTKAMGDIVNPLVDITYDRPFLYILMKDNVPLFVGTVYNPAE